jgi:hypothetical protein
MIEKADNRDNKEKAAFWHAERRRVEQELISLNKEL